MKNTQTVKIIKQALSALVLTSTVLMAPGALAYGDSSAVEILPKQDLETQLLDTLEAQQGPEKQQQLPAQAHKVNINLANFEQLVALPGIGKVKASAIIRYREEVGMFKVLEDLQNIKGIGAKLFAKLVHQIKI